MFDHILELKDVVEEGNHIFIITEWLSMDSYDYINWQKKKLYETDIKKMFKMTV